MYLEVVVVHVLSRCCSQISAVHALSIMGQIYTSSWGFKHIITCYIGLAGVTKEVTPLT